MLPVAWKLPYTVVGAFKLITPVPIGVTLMSVFVPRLLITLVASCRLPACSVP